MKEKKIIPLDELADKLSALRREKVIVLCHGVFDLLHIGHIRYLQKAKDDIMLAISAGYLEILFAEEVITVLLPNSYHGSIEITVILACYYTSLFFGKQPQVIYAKKTY
jgi:FAD synthase